MVLTVRDRELTEIFSRMYPGVDRRQMIDWTVFDLKLDEIEMDLPFTPSTSKGDPEAMLARRPLSSRSVFLAFAFMVKYFGIPAGNELISFRDAILELQSEFFRGVEHEMFNDAVTKLFDGQEMETIFG